MSLKNKGKRFLALGLSVMMVLEIILSFAFSMETKAATKASTSNMILQDGIAITTNKSLEYYGDDVYKVQLKASSAIRKAYWTTSRSYSEDGVYVVPEGGAGYYLLELWGGTGGNGQATLESGGGYGGASGYTYGYVWCDEGDSIVFTIGTRGANNTESTNGGGENHGGTHGSNGIYGVGGGGGYSAVYLFENEHRTNVSMTEAERLSKYLMIAGGGGGGGAGNEWLFEATQRPSGGSGGIVGISASGHLSANDNNGVAGTYFTGANGKSSGNSTAYVGIGGSNIPGTNNLTVFEWFDAPTANDWTGTYNPNIEPGAGSNGNLRGGAGGAGFCGGSGGIMSGWLLATNIGGGGGGSSFIADKVTYTGLSDFVKSYLNGYSDNGNETGSGGALYITYLGQSEDNVADTSHLENVTLSGSISKYFDILSVNTNGNGSYSLNGNTLNVTGVKMTPNDDGYDDENETLLIDIVIKAKSDFLGGNAVDIYSTPFTITAESSTDSSGGVISFASSKDNTTDYANVPLKFRAIAQSHSFSTDNLKTYNTAELYVDEYSVYRNNLSSHWQADYISTIGSYTVKDSGGATVTGNIAKTTVGTYNYTVGFNVVPKKAAATVGPAITTAGENFSAQAKIIVVGTDSFLSGSTTVKTSKTLSNSGDSYQLELDVTGSDSMEAPYNRIITAAGSGTWTVSIPGYYYFGARGGNGGNGGNVTAYHSYFNTTTSATGGAGTKGINVYGVVYLEKGDVVSYTVGTTGSAGKTVVKADEELDAKGGAGIGGTYSSISITKAGGATATPLLIGSGGAGGGGAAAAISDPIFTSPKTAKANGANAVSPNPTSNSTYAGSFTSYNGGSGTAGQASHGWSDFNNTATATAGTAGTQRAGYISTSVKSSQVVNGTTYSVPQDAINRMTGPCVYFSLATADIERQEKDDLADFSLATNISKYFTVNNVTFNNGTTNYSVTPVKGSTVNGNGFTVSTEEGTDGTTLLKLDSLSYNGGYTRTFSGTDWSSDRKVSLKAAISLSFQFDFTRKDGFIGGNDVPVLVPMTGTDSFNTLNAGMTLYTDKNHTSSYNIPTKNNTDNANVPIEWTFNPDDFTTANATIVCGESIHTSDLIINNQIILPSGKDAWKADYVKEVRATGSVESPTKTSSYRFVQQVAPKVETAQKATVTDSVSPEESICYSTVTVQYTVTDSLTNLTYNGPTLITCGEDIYGKITADDGYLMPNSITVSVGGKVLNASAYTYDKETGEIAIAAEQLQSGNIVISGKAELPVTKVKVHYVYEMVDGAVATREEEYSPGDKINYDWLNNFTPAVREHYEFVWDYGNEDGSRVEIMPATDLWITGSYRPLRHTVTINYYKEGTTEQVADSVLITQFYGTSYNIVSPTVTGWVADKAVVSGTVDNDTTINVYYASAKGTLNIFYIYDDSDTEAWTPYIGTIATGEEYNILTPTITGYSITNPEYANAVAGVVTPEQAENGLIVYVYYHPNEYTVSFDAGAGSLSQGEENRTVQFHAQYNYNPSDNTFSSLPTPTLVGRKFAYWKDKDGNKITEDTIVSVASDHTLYAEWEKETYTLIVHYQYPDGTKAAESYREEVEYGATYSVDSPTIPNWTADIPVVQGVKGAGTTIIYVTYVQDEHSLVVKYRIRNEDGTDSPIFEVAGNYEATDYIGTYKAGEIYRVDIPQVPGFELDDALNAGIVQGQISGTMGTENITLTVYFKLKDYQLKIHYDNPDIEDVSHVIHVGEEFIYNTPLIEGYTPSVGQIVAKLDPQNPQDLEYAVTYELNYHTLKIHYHYGENLSNTSLAGQVASEMYETILGYGESYNITSPSVEQYEPTIENIIGIMPDEDLEFWVYYNDIVESEIKVIVHADGDYADKTKQFSGNIKISSNGEETEIVPYILSDGESLNQAVKVEDEVWLTDLEKADGYDLKIEYKLPNSDELVELAIVDSTTGKINVADGVTEIHVRYEKTDVLDTGVSDGPTGVMTAIFSLVSIISILLVVFSITRKKYVMVNKS